MEFYMTYKVVLIFSTVILRDLVIHGRSSITDYSLRLTEEEKVSVCRESHRPTSLFNVKEVTVYITQKYL